jgi:hypothetical protein
LIFYLISIFFIRLATGSASISEGILQNEDKPSSPVIHDFYLHPVQKGVPIFLFPAIDEKEVEFKKEPELGRGRIFRKLLLPGKDEKDYIPFAWNVKTAKLYLDFNRNFDLTDDPDNVFKANEKRKKAQRFTTIPIERKVDIPHEKSPLVLRFKDTKPIHTSVYYVDFTLMDYNKLILYVDVNSSWQGEIDLPNIKALMTVTDDLDGWIGPREESKGLSRDIYNLESIVLKDLSTSATSRSYDFIQAQAITDKIHINTRPYEVQYDFAEHSGEICLKASFKEAKPDMGTVLLRGTHIKQLNFYGDSRVHLFSPSGKLIIPAGKYYKVEPILETPDEKQIFIGFPGKGFTLEKNGEYVLKVGAPLKSTISINPYRGGLNIAYALTGIGNEEYTFLNEDAPPQFEIYKGDKRIFSDKFQFG